jgi:hypothetical protein
MRPDDAFWGARIVAAFSDEALAAVVRKAAYREPRAAEYILSVLIKRRDAILRTWLTVVNPLVEFELGQDDTLRFRNAAVDARAATPPRGYAVSWSRFDNASDTHQPIGSDTFVTSTSARMPAGLERESYVAVTVRTEHPDHPVWAQPVRAYFRRDAGGWTPVGLERDF